MESTEKYPVKILDNLYVFRVVNSDKNEKEKFLELSDVDKIKCLLKQEPSVMRFKSSSAKDKIYTPSFGKYIISDTDKEFLRFDDLNFTRKKSEELFLRFIDESLDMFSYYKKLDALIYSSHIYSSHTL
jgi:hypothetical protein